MKQVKVTFTHRNVVSLFIVYELDTWSRDLSTKFIQGDCLFGAVKLTKNPDPDKYGSSGYGIGLSVHADYRKKDILVLGEGPADGLDDASVIAEAKYSVNIFKSRKKVCLSLLYNAVSSFVFAAGVKIHQFKAKNSEIKPYPLCLGNISKRYSG